MIKEERLRYAIDELREGLDDCMIDEPYATSLGFLLGLLEARESEVNSEFARAAEWSDEPICVISTITTWLHRADDEIQPNSTRVHSVTLPLRSANG